MLRKLLSSFRNSLTAKVCPVNNHYGGDEPFENFRKITYLTNDLQEAYNAITTVNDLLDDCEEAISSPWRIEFALILHKAIQHQSHKLRNVHI